jgi:hypothetical protein
LRERLAHEDHLAVRYLTGVIEATLAVRAGHLEHAETMAKDCFDRGTAIGDADAAAFHAAHLITIRWYQGRLAELLPMLAAQVHSPDLKGVDNSLFAAFATAAALAGDRLAAAGAIATLCGRDLADLPRSSSWLPTMYGIAEAAHLIGDAETSARVYELVSPYAHLPVVASFGAMCLGSAEHVLGVAALTTGELDRAAGHFDAAIRANLALGHRPAVLMSQARHGQALARRGAGDGTVASCTRTGQEWLVQYGSRSALVPHSVGMSYLAVLLANPGRDVAAIDLAAGPGHQRGPEGVGHPVLDRTAVHQYRQRVEQLRSHIDALEASGRRDELAGAIAERDWLLAELAAASGITGRIRVFTHDAERARLAVGRAIRRSFDTIDRIDTVIAAHLRGSVHTGARCSYQPN